MSRQIRALWEPIRMLAHGDIGVEFTAVGAPFANPVRLISITNATDAIVDFSFDDVSTNIVVLNGQTKTLDIATNRSATGEDLSIKAGTTIYAAGTVTMGNIYVEVMYAG